MKNKIRLLLLCIVLTTSTIHPMFYYHWSTNSGGETTTNTNIPSFSSSSFSHENRTFSPAQKMQLATSLARLPLALAANFLQKNKNHKSAYVLRVLTDLVRFVDNSLSIVNYDWNKYNIFLTGYDLIRCARDIERALSNAKPEVHLPSETIHTMMASISKIVLPFIETGAACCAALNNRPDERFIRLRAQSISTCAQLLSDYLDSSSQSIESQCLLACLVIATVSAGYDFATTKKEDLLPIHGGGSINQVARASVPGNNQLYQGREALRERYERERRAIPHNNNQQQQQNYGNPQPQQAVHAHLNGTRVTIERVQNNREQQERNGVVETTETSRHERNGSNPQCLGCHTAYHNNDQLAVLDCNHTYHSQCLGEQQACGACNRPMRGHRPELVTIRTNN